MMTVSSIRLPAVIKPVKGTSRRRVGRAQDEDVFGALVAGKQDNVIDAEFEEMIEPVEYFNRHKEVQYNFMPFFRFKGVYVNYYT